MGSELRELAPDYEVAHTTLVPYFDRPEVAKQLSQPARQLQAERRAAAARCTAEPHPSHRVEPAVK